MGVGRDDYPDTMIMRNFRRNAIKLSGEGIDMIRDNKDGDE